MSRQKGRRVSLPQYLILVPSNSLGLVLFFSHLSPSRFCCAVELLLPLSVRSSWSWDRKRESGYYGTDLAPSGRSWICLYWEPSWAQFILWQSKPLKLEQVTQEPGRKWLQAIGMKAEVFQGANSSGSPCLLQFEFGSSQGQVYKAGSSRNKW